MKRYSNIIIFFIFSLVIELSYILSLGSFKVVEEDKDELIKMFLQLNIPTIVAITMKIIIEYQKDENKIKKLNIVRKILNIISVIYLLFYELFLILVIVVAENLKYVGPWQ